MSKLLTAERLEEIRAADAARTPGEWTNTDAKRGETKSLWVAETAQEQQKADGTPSRYGPDRDYIANCIGGSYGKSGRKHSTWNVQAVANAHFIATCSTAIHDLLGHIDALECEAKRLREALEGIAKQPLDAWRPGETDDLCKFMHSTGRAALAEGEKEVRDE